MSVDYGPIPVSQVKKESSRIFAELEAGRRVLVSRYGKVVAAIEPATHPDHLRLLAAYASPGFCLMPELTATDISQEGPADRIRAAERGNPTLLTRNQKAYGVLTRFTGSAAALVDPDEQERLLARFEAEYPDATPAEFSAEVARIEQLAATTAPAVAEVLRDAEVLGDHGVDAAARGDDAAADLFAWVEGMRIQGLGHARAGDMTTASRVFDRAIERAVGLPDERIRRRVRMMMLTSAQLHLATGDPGAAVALASVVTAELDSLVPAPRTPAASSGQ